MPPKPKQEARLSNAQCFHEEALNHERKCQILSFIARKFYQTKGFLRFFLSFFWEKQILPVNRKFKIFWCEQIIMNVLHALFSIMFLSDLFLETIKERKLHGWHEMTTKRTPTTWDRRNRKDNWKKILMNPNLSEEAMNEGRSQKILHSSPLLSS